MTTTTINEPLPIQNPQPGAGSADAAKPARSPAAIRALIMPIALLIIVAYFAVMSSGLFLSARNLSQLAIELSVTAVLALGMLLVILPGHIDLSAGSGVGLIGGLAAVLVFWHGWLAWAAMGTATFAALLVWWLMGTIIVKERVPAFIITLGGLLIFRGLHWLVIKNSTVPIVTGGQTNLYSVLTTYYLSPTLSLVLAGVIGIVLIGIAVAQNRHPAVAGNGELLVMRAFITAQCVLLLVLVCNGYRGVPLPAVILGAGDGRHLVSHPPHTVRPVPVRDRRQ